MKQRRFANKAVAMSSERWLYGIHAVSAWLGNRPESVRSVLYCDDGRNSPRVREILLLAEAARIRMRSVTTANLAEVTGTHRHQGVAACCSPFPYALFDDVLLQRAPLVLVIDQLQDPQNLGAILRSCDAAGAGAVILPKDGTVGVTPLVEAAAAGAAAFVRVCRVTNLVRAIDLLKRHNYWVAGLAASSETSLFDSELPEPVALVLGGETGIRRLVSESCDMRFSIPMRGRVESLNASVAAAVALFEVRRRQASAPSEGARR